MSLPTQDDLERLKRYMAITDELSQLAKRLLDCHSEYRAAITEAREWRIAAREASERLQQSRAMFASQFGTYRQVEPSEN